MMFRKGIDEKVKAAAVMAGQRHAEQQRKYQEGVRKQWEGIEVGDGVLLSREVSKRVMKVFDDDGDQVRYDGVVMAIEGNVARVRVLGEFAYGVGVILSEVWAKDVERIEGVHYWLRGKARAIARRRDGYGEVRYWMEDVSDQTGEPLLRLPYRRTANGSRV